jgi:hypothetical protein
MGVDLSVVHRNDELQAAMSEEVVALAVKLVPRAVVKLGHLLTCGDARVELQAAQALLALVKEAE